MKTKSALFISAALTTFVLVIVASVVTVIRSNANETMAQAETTQQLAATLQTASVVATAQRVVISVDEAASIAARILGRQDIYSISASTVDGTIAYKVTFSSGDIVYIGLDGQVISVTQVPVTVTYSEAGEQEKPEARGGRQSNSEHGGEND